MNSLDRKIRNQKIVDLRLNGGMTLSAIGKQFGISRQAIYYIVRWDEQILREYHEDMERLAGANLFQCTQKW
jgi:predicted DNA-binding protein YlxM (UPF0122 family)